MVGGMLCAAIKFEIVYYLYLYSRLTPLACYRGNKGIITVQVCIPCVHDTYPRAKNSQRTIESELLQVLRASEVPDPGWDCSMQSSSLLELSFRLFDLLIGPLHFQNCEQLWVYHFIYLRIATSIIAS